MIFQTDITVQASVHYNAQEDRLWTAIINDGIDILPGLTESQRSILQRIAMGETEEAPPTATARDIQTRVARIEDEQAILLMYDALVKFGKVELETLKKAVIDARDDIVL